MGNWISKKCELLSADDGTRLLLANERVVVYVWTTQSLGGRRKSGHVSVEITSRNKNGTLLNNTYISLWPIINLNEKPKDWPKEKARPQFQIDEKWCLIKDYTSDRLLEKRKPEYVFCFYDLNTTKIIDAFKKFRKNEESFYGWMGKYIQKVESEQFDDDEELKKQGKPTYQSCVSLACLTLDAGGINRWLTRKDEIVASSKGTSEASEIQSEDSFGEFRNLKIIQPSKNVGYYILEQLVSGYIMSPDVLLGRLKVIKKKEWAVKENVRRMGRMTAVTKVSLDGNERKIEYSYQEIDAPIPNSVNSVKHPEIDEMFLEWLPVDEKMSYRTIFILLFIVTVIVSLCVPKIS